MMWCVCVCVCVHHASEHAQEYHWPHQYCSPGF